MSKLFLEDTNPEFLFMVDLVAAWLRQDSSYSALVVVFGSSRLSPSALASTLFFLEMSITFRM